MTRALKIFFLIVFVFNWVPQGGAIVRYPTLEKMLERVDREYPPEIAKEIRFHSIPSDMCGVKAVIKNNEGNFGFGSTSRIMSHAPMAVLDVFVVKPQKEIFLLNFAEFVSELAMPQAVLSPPPRLLA